MAEPVDALPTHPKTFGAELKKLRENAGVTIEDLISETKVSRRILEALEDGKYQYLPERVFSRNFVIQYATYVGCDPDDVVIAFDAAWKTFLVTSGSHPAVIVPEQEPRTPIRWRFWIPVILGVVVVVVVVTIMVRGARHEEDLAPDPRRFSSVVPTPTIFPRTFSPTPILNAASADPAAETARVAVLIEVAGDQECWIQYRDREGVVESQLLGGGARVTIHLETPALLSLGNAGAARITVDGQAYTELGKPGQVVHCELSGDGLVKLGA